MVVAVVDYYNGKIKIIDRIAQNITELSQFSIMPVSLLVKDEKLYIGGLRKLYTGNERI